MLGQVCGDEAGRGAGEIMNELTLAIQEYVEKQAALQLARHIVDSHWDGNGSVDIERVEEEIALAELDAAVTKTIISSVL